MTNFSPEINDQLLKNYTDYYQGGSEAEWRWISAKDKVENIVNKSSGINHDTVLDIGCGDGAILSQLSNLGFGSQHYGLEISESALTELNKKDIPSLNGACLFDGYTIPYENIRFDLAILSHVIEHVEQPRLLLREAGRVAKHVFVEVPLDLTLRLPDKYVKDRVGHINFFTKKTILLLLQTTNFEVLSADVTNPSLEVYKYYWRKKGFMHWIIKESLLRINPALAIWLFKYHCAILCRSVESDEAMQT